jgi:Dolichyl-phosphate-mannose-protein mannosyltransferase
VHTLVTILVMAGMTAVGHVLLMAARLRLDLSWAGNLVVAFLVGSGVTTLLAFWVSLLTPSLGLKVSLAALAASLVVVAGMLARWLASLLAWRPRISVSAVVVTPLMLFTLLDLGLLLAVVFRGDPGWDGLFIWGIKARYFAAIGGVPDSFFTDLSRQWSHLDYPLLFPLMEAIVYSALGVPNEHANMVIIVVFVVGMVVLFHELVREAVGPVLAVVFALVLVTVPAFWTNAVRAYADLPLALFLLGGGGLVCRWLIQRRSADVVVGGVLLAFGVWVKRDGLMVWAAAAAAVLAWTVALAIKNRQVTCRPLVGYLAPAVAVVPWWATVAQYHLVDRNYAPVSVPWLVHHVDRVPTLLHALAGQLLLVSSWGLVWVLVASAVVLRPPIRSAARAFLLWAIAVHLLSLTMIYTFSTWDPYMDHVNSSIDRLVFQILPLALLFLATAIRFDPAAAFGPNDFPALRRSAGPRPRGAGGPDEGFAVEAVLQAATDSVKSG